MPGKSRPGAVDVLEGGGGCRGAGFVWTGRGKERLRHWAVLRNGSIPCGRRRWRSCRSLVGNREGGREEEGGKVGKEGREGDGIKGD